MFSGWNLTKVTTFLNMFSYAHRLERISLGTPLKTNSTASSTSGAANITSWAVNCTSMDFSAINAGIFTSSSNDQAQYCVSLIDFVPSQGYQKNTTFANCMKLSVDSVLRIFDALKTVTAATTITLPTQAKNRLTTEQIAIATQKGWTVA